uniref:Uncharacterized protein n=1 Tax=Timema genevievae TaxID=629358 RepID=A0A7R9PLC0_TIMGE|nr:unnamed protein product [Timema genevievae]
MSWRLILFYPPDGRIVTVQLLSVSFVRPIRITSTSPLGTSFAGSPRLVRPTLQSRTRGVYSSLEGCSSQKIQRIAAHMRKTCYDKCDIDFPDLSMVALLSGGKTPNYLNGDRQKELQFEMMCKQNKRPSSRRWGNGETATLELLKITPYLLKMP